MGTIGSHNWSVKIWYKSGGFEQISYITEKDARTIAAEAAGNDRVQSHELHNPCGMLVPMGLTTDATKG